MKIYLILSLLLFVSISNAQVGVGTTDPKSTLEVVGQPSVTTVTDGFIPPKLQRSQLIAKTGYGVDQTGAVVFVTDVSGTTNTATVKVTTAGYYHWDGDSWEPLGNSGDGRNIYTEDGSLTGNRIVTQGTSNLSFTSTASSGTSHFSVDGSTFNVNAVANNVGIGTSNPLFPLHVQSNVFGFAIDRHNSGPGNQSIISLRKNLSNDPSVFVPLTLGSNIGSISFSGVNGGTTAFGPYVPLGNATRIMARAEENFTPTSAASGLGFYTTPVGQLGAIERLTIKGNGNVGIGTTSPNAPLQFANTLASRKTVLWEDANNDHQFYGLGINVSTLRYQVSGTVSNHVFYAGTSATTSNELMRIQGNGNVGIGTATPVAKLDLNGIKLTGAGVGTGGANDAASQAIIPAGNNGASRYNDWPAGWGGGLSTWDIVGATTVFNSYVTRSDFRLKNDIKSIDKSIFSNFMKIRPVTYFMKEQTKEMEGLQYGFIAQEIRDLFPSMVTKSDDPNGTIGMNYQALISPTIYVVQQQQAKIEELQKQVDSQNEKLSKMEEELKQIKELLSK